MSYVTGKTIKELRENKKFTQRQLADMLQISDKTISKWETDRGLPEDSQNEDMVFSMYFATSMDYLDLQFKLNMIQ